MGSIPITRSKDPEPALRLTDENLFSDHTLDKSAVFFVTAAVFQTLVLGWRRWSRAAPGQNFRQDENPEREGITPIEINGKERLMIVFDGGIMPERKRGHYRMLNYEHHNIGPIPKR